MTVGRHPAAPGHPSVRRTSVRVALAATAVVAVAYFVVAVAVVLIVQANLTDQIDQRIASSFVRLPHSGPPSGGPYEAPPPDRLGGAPVILWEVHSDGHVETQTTNAILPAAYTSVKHGIIGFTRALALELARNGITVNAICPSYTLTPMVEKDLFTDTLGNDEELIAAARANHPIGRFAEPPEIAAAATWLLSDKASFVTGTALSVDGGYTAP